MKRGEYRFEIALSFAGDNKRNRVREVATLLCQHVGDEKVFFDEWYEAELAGPDAHVVLQDIYRKQTRLVVTCVCKRYNEKAWTQEEWRAIQSFERTVRDAGDGNVERLRFLPLRFGDGDIDGLFDTAIVPDMRERSPPQIAELILKRLALSVGDEPKTTRSDAGTAAGATGDRVDAADDVRIPGVPLRPRHQTVFDQDVEKRLRSLFETKDRLLCARKLLEDHGPGWESMEHTSAAEAAKTLCELEPSEAIRAWTVSVNEQLGLLNTADEKRAWWTTCKTVHLTLLTRLVNPDWLDWWRDQSERESDARLIRLAIMSSADEAEFGVEVLAGRLIDDRWVQFSDETGGRPSPRGRIHSQMFSELNEPSPEAAVDKLGKYLMHLLNMHSSANKSPRDRDNEPPDRMSVDEWSKLDSRLRHEVANSYYLLIPRNDHMFASEASLGLLRKRLPNLPKFLLSEPDAKHPSPFVCVGWAYGASIRSNETLVAAGTEEALSMELEFERRGRTNPWHLHVVS